MITRGDCETMDRTDALAAARDRFLLPADVIYLDGNSLGALPARTAARLADAVTQQWGQGLIRSWNAAGWVNLPEQLGRKIAGLLGAADNEVIVADSTSINIFKLLAGALTMAGGERGRRVILSERGNFPTDLYMSQGLNSLLGDIYELRLVDGNIENAFDATTAVALITQVDYCSGRLHDMKRLNAKAREAGTRIVWDLSHSAGAVPVALNDDGAELAVGCGYKYLNGGPGAPAFAYLAATLQRDFPTPLSGWFGHAAPFAFDTNYRPAPGIERLQCGTPSVLAMLALAVGLETFDGISMQDLRQKSLRLSDLFWTLMDAHCGPFGFSCVSPRAHADRGSQLSFAHEHAYPVMQALIDRGVIGDFRQPNLLRFGFTPLYLRFADMYDAVMIIRAVMATEAWAEPRYAQRNRVT